MMAARPPRVQLAPRRATPAEKWHLGAVALMFTAYIVHMGATFEVFFGNATRVAIAIEYGILTIYMVIAGMRGQIRLAGFTGLFLVYLVWQTYLFGIVTGIPANPFNAATYGTISLALVLYLSRLRVTLLLTLLAIISTLYLLFYLASWSAVVSYNGQDHMRGLLLADGVRAERAYLAGQFASFILYLGVALLRRRLWAAIPLIGLASWAIFLSGSRLFQATTTIVLLSALIITYLPALRRIIAYVLMSIFVISSLVGIYGYFDSSFNPYEPLFNDPSGRARYYEYQDATRVARDHLLTGIGISSSNEELQFFVRPKQPFYESDLGLSGIVFNFGIPFALLLMTAAALSMICIPDERARQSPLAIALFWTNQGAVLGSFFTMAIFGGSGTLLFGMTLLLWLIGGYFEPLLPRTWKRI